MPVCPKCNKKYKAGTEICKYCGCMLGGNLPEEKPEEDYVDDAPAFLTSADSGVAVDMLKARLTSAGIQSVYLKPHGHGDLLKVYMGSLYFGADIYVPSKMLEKAKIAIDLEPEDSQPEELQPEEPQLEDDENDEPGDGESAPVSAETGADDFETPEDALIDKRQSAPGEPAGKKLKGRVITIAVIILVLAAYFLFDGLLDFFRKLLGY
jgi:hypothetical protein